MSLDQISHGDLQQYAKKVTAYERKFEIKEYSEKSMITVHIIQT